MSRILHITKSLHGGGGLYASRLNDALVEAGHDSAFFCLDDSSLRPAGGVGKRVAPMYDRALSGAIRRASKTTFHSFFRMSEWAMSPTPGPQDIVHLHSITGFIGTRGLRQLLHEKPQVFWTAHNPWLFTGGCVAYDGCNAFERECHACPILTNPFKPLAMAEYHAKRRFIEASGVRVIANSEWMASMMRRSPIFADVPEIPVIPPIVNEVFSLPGNRTPARAALSIDEESFVIGLSASSLTDEGKGIAPFFESLPAHAPWLGKATFLLIGDGRVPIPDGVKAIFTGRVNSPARLAELYGCCDCLASPSFMETFGMAILEAQACGTPVVAFETGGTPEAVAPNPACHLIPNRDFQAMHECLEACAVLGPPQHSTRANLAQWVASRHNSAYIAAAQIKIYQNFTR